MEQPQDEQITCASCGSSFLFSAADAAARVERGHMSPPTLCKPCWREKRAKNTNRGDGQGQAAPPRGRDPQRQNERYARPARYTGDVNEYRSPMADPHFATYPSYGRASSPAPGGRGFPITCAACGAAATVPFRPVERQKVYCRACFQAEKPS